MRLVINHIDNQNLMISIPCDLIFISIKFRKLAVSTYPNKSILATLVLAALSGNAMANGEQESITVYGQKIERTQQETKESVAVVDADMMEELSITELSDVYNYTANVSNISSASGGDQFAIRGVSQNSQSTNAGTAENATLYIDGVAYTGFASKFAPKSLWDTEQVEILRGPQSTNMGRNALLGAVVLTTKKPDTYENDAAVQVDMGNDGRQTYNGMVNVALSEKAAFRLTGSYSEADGYTKNSVLNEDNYDANKDHNLRGQFLLAPNEDLSINLMVQSAKMEEGSDTYLVIDGEDIENRDNRSSFQETNEYELFATSLNVDYAINSQIAVTSTTAYLEGERYAEYNENQLNPNQSPTISTPKDKVLSQEVRLNYTGEKLMTSGGVYLTRVDLQNDLSIGDFSAESSSYAVFGEADYYVTDSVIASAGLRYDSETYDVESSQGDYDTKHEAWLPQAGVTYLIDDKKSTSLFYKRGYRIGGAELAGDFWAPKLNTFDPEYLDTVELAFRSSWLDDKLYVNTNVYYGKWTDQQVMDYDVNATTNAGKSTIAGTELEVQYYPTSSLALYYSLGFAHTEFDEFVNRGVDQAGNTFAFSPDFTSSIGGRYYMTDNFYAGGNVNYQGESYGDVENTIKLDSFVLVNLNVGYEQDNWKLEGYVNNLTDEFYVTGINPVSYNQGSTFNPDWVYGNHVQAGNPREFGLRATYNF